MHRAEPNVTFLLYRQKSMQIRMNDIDYIVSLKSKSKKGRIAYSGELVVSFINLLHLSKGRPGNAVKPVLIEANLAVAWVVTETY